MLIKDEEMKITRWALSAAIAAACLGGSVFAQAPTAPMSNDYGYYSSEAAPVASASIRDDSPVVPASSSDYSVVPAAAQAELQPEPFLVRSQREPAAESGGFFRSPTEDPWNLLPPIAGWQIGGWTQIGYHTYNNALFNQHGDNVRLNQAWLYAEKVADGSDGLGFGGRIDYVYGVDAQDTQAFGIDNNSWDNGWDNGIYGNALPQLYAEVAYGDLSVKVGHFFTLIGYEVVAAPGNFFFSHSYTMYNSEPFTHTGVLGTYNAADALTLYGGWVMGWDSGFEDNGDAFLGGYSLDLGDNLNITNQYVVGRFGENKGLPPRAGGEVGFMTSFIATAQLTDDVSYVLWVDVLDTDNDLPAAVRPTKRETYDWNNYLLVSLTDWLTWGTRAEWYNIDKGIYIDPTTNQLVSDGRSDIYALTTGFNIAAGSNLLFRPEIRWDWNKDRLLQDVPGNPGVLEIAGNASQTTFGMDAILEF